ncbi:MAG: hypothetical protein SGJ27_27125 [Candidatus Melainabacteria bacterium]|nr:hypothetical protein [Candidatus Melainabacteria bacterium]
MNKPSASKASILIAFIATSNLVFADEARAGDTNLPEIPSYAPNPFKKAPTVAVNLADNIGALERTLYADVNENKPEDLRISALERTVFGTSYANAKLSLATRTVGLEKVVDRLLAGRKLFEEKRWTETIKESEEVLKLLGKDYKSLVRAEVHYRLGMCQYELSNIKRAATTPGVKLNGVMIRDSKDNLSKAQEYYKSLGQPDTAQKITAFMATFKDQSEKSFLY